MSSPVDTSMPRSYTDFTGLGELRGKAQKDQNSALRESAQQFEGLFIQMMLKSMREANAPMKFDDSLRNAIHSRLQQFEVTHAPESLLKRAAVGLIVGDQGNGDAVLLLTRRTAGSASLMAVVGLALLMAVIGGSVLLGGSGLLAAYVMGLVLGFELRELRVRARKPVVAGQLALGDVHRVQARAVDARARDGGGQPVDRALVHHHRAQRVRRGWCRASAGQPLFDALRLAVGLLGLAAAGRRHRGGLPRRHRRFGRSGREAQGDRRPSQQAALAVPLS